MQLFGKFHFKLELPQESSDWSAKKKKRPRNENDDASVGAVVANTNGLYFVVTDNANSSNNSSQLDDEYLVILPQHLQRDACDAVRFHWDVILHSYIRRQEVLVHHWNMTTNKYNDPSGSFSCKSLEVHNMEVIVEERHQPQNKQTLAVDVCMSRLPQVLEQELLADQKKLKYFSFQATVDSISPIIAIVPSDPFCMLELYDYESMQSCVVVLKGIEPLKCHAAIQPGDDIRLYNVKRQKWSVPDETHPLLLRRIPRYVFVASKAECIEWGENNSITLPSTPSPLIALEGTITSVNVTSSIIHVICRTNNNDNNGSTSNLAAIHLSHFPMSTELQLGLRKGAIVRAVNVHILPWLDPIEANMVHYGTCLRSSLCLLQLATKHQRIEENEDITKELKYWGGTHAFIPFKYGQIKSSYFGQALQSQVSNWKVEDAESIRHVVQSVFNLLRQGDGSCEELSLKNLVDIDDYTVKQKMKRSAYEEFFSHASEISETNKNCGCHMMHSASNAQVELPITVSLSKVKAIAHDTLNQHLIEKFFQADIASHHQKGKGGWTTSIQLTSEDIYVKLQGRKRQVKNNVTIIMFGTIQSIDDDNQPMSFADKCMELPLSVYAGSVMAVASSVGDFIALRFQSVVMSCVCLGSYHHGSDEKKVGTSCFDLKAWNSLGTEGQHRKGSCTLFRLNGFVFVTSFLVHCSNVAHVEIQRPQYPTRSKPPNVLSIYQCLSPQAQGIKHGRFEGLLCRQRFKFAKIRQGQFNACVLTLSHIPPSMVGPFCGDDVSSIQSLELKISVSIPRIAIEEMLKAIPRILHTVSMLEEQVALAVAWWKVADSGKSAPVVAGGLDELILPWPRVGLVARISVPMSALEQSGLGYARFKCDLDQIHTTLERVAAAPKVCGSCNRNDAIVTCIGGSKFLPGMLDRRPRRRLEEGCSRDGIIVGELAVMPSFAGVSSLTLAELHWKMCQDIRNNTKSQLAPSMVQLIRNAKLLSISFCRAQVECTRCFKALVLRHSITVNPVSGVVDSIPKHSFWDLPLPMEHDEPKSEYEDMAKHSQSSVLCCPNDCSLDAAQVRWECSGVVDDGTGQAKLHAEREAALTLLNMTLENRTRIAQGAWYTEVGLIFSRASPPKAFVKQSIREAQQLAVQRFGARYVTDAHVLNLLAPLARAEYLLYEHCRYGMTLHRPLDFYVRCKPIASFHLNQTHVEMATPGIKETHEAIVAHTSTYSLPPLKLNLVDCVGVRNETRESSWELITSMLYRVSI